MRNKTLKICQGLVKICQSCKISQNLVTLVTYIESDQLLRDGSVRERERERERNKMKREGSSVEIKRENELKRQRETEKGRR